LEKKDDFSKYLTLGHKVPNKEKIYFGFGVLANTLIVGVVSLYLLDYYINIIKIRYELFILANIIYLIWNTFNDVIFGYYADRTKHKLGRRMPYIRYGAPFFALAFIFFWFPFPGSAPGDINNGQSIKFLQLVIAYLFFDTMLTLVILSFVALPPEMTESTEERTMISLYRTIFTLIGGLTILLVPTIMSLGLDVFRIFIIIMGFFCMCAYFVVSYGVKERRKLYEIDDVQQEKSNIIKDITQTFKNKAFISFIIYNFCVIYITTMIINFTPFLTNIFGLEGSSATIILVAVYSGFLITIPIFVYLGKRIESRIQIILTSLICLIGIFSLFLIDLIFDIIELYWLILFLDGVLMGLGIFYYPYMSDCIDCDELNTNGRRREAMHFGLNALCTKPAENFPAIFGAFILLITGFIQGGSVSEQPASAILGLKLMVAIIPMILAIFLIISQFVNPLKGEFLKEMKINVLELHKVKENK
jgi:GPH family glycoside/pentoside/hexuronide:cation symporter